MHPTAVSPHLDRAKRHDAHLGFTTTAPMALVSTIACALLVCAPLVAARRQNKPLQALTKISASLAFILTAALHDAWHLGSFGRFVLAGLVLGAIGDTALLSNEKKPFMAGIGAFLLSHVAYVAAFIALTVSWTGAAASLLLLVPAAYLIRRWIGDNAGSLGAAVTAYVVDITTMVSCATGSLVHDVSPQRVTLLAAAFLFFVSDICVARERFVAQSFNNRLVGLPLYYAAQLLFAWSLAMA